MRQRNKHLPPALSDTADVVLHNGDLARKAVLITQPLEYPLRCVTLLLRTILILFQDTVDNTDERIELRADRRPRPDITRWHRIAQHLPDRARVDPKTTSRFALAQTLNHYRVANPPIQFHSLHPPPFAPKCKGLSLTEFCSGATRLSGRFSGGLLLRRSQLDGAAVPLALAYRHARRSLSLPDSFALALSKTRSWTLLSGDGSLRALALEEEVECHGVLWLLDRLHEHRILRQDALTVIRRAGSTPIGALTL